MASKRTANFFLGLESFLRLADDLLGLGCLERKLVKIERPEVK
jgi:hypothetical protein